MRNSSQTFIHTLAWNSLVEAASDSPRAKETADVDFGDLIYKKLDELPKVNSPHGEEWDEEDEG